MERFWAKVGVRGPDECWPWLASTRNGYGQFHLDGDTVYAHIVAFELANGPLPEGAIVLHTCDYKLCCNGRHLEAGTHAKNSEDAVKRNRWPTGERNGAAKLSEESVSRIFELRAAGLSHREIGLEVGVSRRYVGHILAGHYRGKAGVWNASGRKLRRKRSPRKAGRSGATA